MYRKMTIAYMAASATIVALAAAAWPAHVHIDSTIHQKLASSASVSRASAGLRVYRIEPQPRSLGRLKAFAKTAQIPESCPLDSSGKGFVLRGDTVHAMARFDEERGRYVCARQAPSELESRAKFPDNLNQCAVSLLRDLVRKDEKYMSTGMNMFVVQEPGDVAPNPFRRTYKFGRILDGSVVLAEEGSATVQFDRYGRATMVEIPAVKLTPCAVADPLEPAELPARLEALVAKRDSIQIGEHKARVDSVVVRSVASSFRKEEREGRGYLVPCQSVLVRYFPRGEQPVEAEHHFSLDRASRDYDLADPWMKSR